MSLALDGAARPRETAAGGARRALLRLRGGETLAVDLDGENAGYLRAAFERHFRWFEGRRHRRFVWFETAGQHLIGADLMAVVAIDWLSPGAAAPAVTALDGDHLVLRFTDRPPLRLPQIEADDIDRLRGATLCSRDFTPAGSATAIPVATLELATLPARWMDAEPL